MSNLRILTDSTADVPPDIARRLNITIVPAYVQIGEQNFRDGEEISRAEFYQQLPTLSRLPTTSVPPIHDFTVAFRNLVSETDQVVAVLVSSTLSGMLNSARLGSQEVPELTVHLVDSGQLAMGTGWQVIVAAEAAAEGKSAEEIIALIKEIQPRIRVFAILDTLHYLYHSGRVAWVRALAAHVLRIKPLIEFRRGEAVLIGQVRTRRKAIERLLAITTSLGPLERLAVMHTQAPDIGAFYTAVQGVFPEGEIPISEVGPVVGTHVGPHALAIAAIVAA